MKTQIEEVEHKKSGGFTAADAGLAFLTAGASLIASATNSPVTHEVTVRDSHGKYGIGIGATKEEARRNAIKNL